MWFSPLPCVQIDVSGQQQHRHQHSVRNRDIFATPRQLKKVLAFDSCAILSIQNCARRNEPKRHSTPHVGVLAFAYRRASLCLCKRVFAPSAEQHAWDQFNHHATTIFNCRMWPLPIPGGYHSTGWCWIWLETKGSDQWSSEGKL